MGSGEVAIVALSTMISLKVTFSDGLGVGNGSAICFGSICFGNHGRQVANCYVECDI